MTATLPLALFDTDSAPVPAPADPGRPAITIVVYGQPAPQGSKHGRPIYRGTGAARVFTGKVAQVESSKEKVNTWREAVKAAARDVIDTIPGWVPLDGPLEASIVCTVRKPTSAPKRRRTWPAAKPDLSKLLRSTEDALTDAGIWRDDARVVRYRDLAKVYPGEDPQALDVPGAVIHVWAVTG